MPRLIQTLHITTMKNPLRWSLHWQIFSALILAVIVGCGLLPILDSTLANQLEAICIFTGQLFMNALKMMIVPLIVASIISGVLQMANEKGLGRIGLKTCAYYTVSGAVAVLIGLLVVNWIQPGEVASSTAQALLGNGGEVAGSQGLLDKVSGRGSEDLFGVFLRMFPSNIVSAASSNGQLLGVICFSILFGLFIGQLKGMQKETQCNFWEGAQTVMIRMTQAIIRFAPIGVFALVTPVLWHAPFGALIDTLAWFFVTVVLALTIHFAINLALILRLLGKIQPLQHYRAMAPVLLTAFSTASSSGTLPLTMETVEKKAQLSKKTCAFTLPLGATVNMDGTALYECVVVLFIAQLYAATGQAPLDISQQVLVVILALTTSIGVAGIPAASLVAIAVILPAVGLPVEAIGVVWVTDRLLDMGRTAVNVFSDTVAAVVIARSEGECPYPLETIPKT